MTVIAVFCLQSIKDPAALTRYREDGRYTLSKYGARFLAGPNVLKSLEGDPLEGVVMLEFDSPDAAEAWYGSQDYQSIVGIRQAAAPGFAFVVETRE